MPVDLLFNKAACASLLSLLLVPARSLQLGSEEGGPIENTLNYFGNLHWNFQRMTQLKKLTVWGSLPSNAVQPFLELPLLESLALDIDHSEGIRPPFTFTSQKLTSLSISGGEPGLVSLSCFSIHMLAAE